MIRRLPSYARGITLPAVIPYTSLMFPQHITNDAADHSLRQHRCLNILMAFLEIWASPSMLQGQLVQPFTSMPGIRSNASRASVCFTIRHMQNRCETLDRRPGETNFFPAAQSTACLQSLVDYLPAHTPLWCGNYILQELQPHPA